ncbi:mechanosensitive channel MscK [Pseudomonas turukhanskensis]|uniref:Potassium transporter KefA n=1 Tax=Pseudomonas turukhanskensis TaxID=1806536 RepID=A0A9W6NHA4_9PSED|nr:mechanosensitive channel MscK [Pseudomonas turukhanskensis]GLK90536.1 potassium transporter KefA [Pseudomonas turukhanskensis]
MSLFPYSLRSRFISKWVTASLLGLALIVPSLQAAEPPAAADVQRSLDSLADRKLAETDAANVKQMLENTLALLAEKNDAETRLIQLKQKLTEAPKLTADNQRELTKLKSSQVDDFRQRYGALSIPQLEQKLTDLSTQLSDWQKALAEANSDILTAQTRPERAQAEIASGQTRAQEITNLLKVGKEANKPLPPERRDQLNAEQAALSAKITLRRAELAGNNVLQDLGNGQRDLLVERIARAEQTSNNLQTLISEKRRAQSEKTLVELSKEAQNAGSDSVVALESAQNLKLSDYLLRATDRLNDLTKENLLTKQQLDSVNQADQSLEEQINVLKGSLLLSKILYQQKQSLPHLSMNKDLADEIADIRLYQFNLDQSRDQYSSPQAYVDSLLAKQPAEQVTPELRRTLLDLANTRSELLERLSRELNALLNESITLQLNQKQLQATAKALRATLEEQMFWIPSNKPLDFSWLRVAPRYLQSQMADLPWGAGLKQLVEALGERPWFFLPLLLVCGLLIWQRSTIYRKLNELHEDIGHYKRDSQLHTPLALLLNILLALPVSLLLALGGLALRADARGQNAALGLALLEMAQAWLVFYTLYRILAPGGVAELHFRWPRPQVDFLSKKVRNLGLVVMALVAVVSVAEQQPAALAEDVIGIVTVLTCFCLMTWLLGKLLLGEQLREHASPFRLVIGAAFTLLPFALIIAVGFGYYYTSLKLTDRLINTLYLLIVWLIIEAAFVRGLAVAARRLAYARALAKRQAQAKENVDGDEVPVETPTLDIDQVNQQSLRLIRLALLAGFIGCLYWVWADLISVFAYLDNVTLYQYVSGTGATATQVPISLMDVLGALLIIGVTIALANNLPGLLEVLVLSRLSLAQGSAYATTTLLSYAIAGIGIVSTLSTLGVSWDKLQWLVAALSVGIGFGMQAIFANFISGIILLFERPVRIGDLVTIGTVTGTVNRIRIRATHITDGDRKAVIVPNQTILTSQLINWTLTDTITRIVLTFNVQRGTDLDLVRKLMIQAVQENSRVLRDPAPTVQLTSYGASTLDHELKIYVRELGDRGPATDELNRRIDQLFRANDINSSSTPKMEIFLANREGQEQKVCAEHEPETPAP